jgi:nucleoid-associated protein YgaU
MSATVAADIEGRKHMFGISLDFERSFEHNVDMHRTYVRRRLTVLVAVIGLTMVLGAQMARALVATPLPASSRTYVVEPGDTLWSIASMIAPDHDPRAVVLEIERVNEDAADGLVPGQTLAIPSPT